MRLPAFRLIPPIFVRAEGIGALMRKRGFAPAESTAKLGAKASVQYGRDGIAKRGVIIATPSMQDSPKAISRFPVPRLEELPEDVRARILAVQEKAGFVPNVFLVLAHRPDEFRAFFAYHDALMLKEGGGLTKGEREMIVVATSAANDCHYCVVAHGALVRVYEKKPLLADQVAINYRKADVTARQRCMLDFAMKVTLRSAEVDESDFAALRELGFTDEDAWDIAGIAAFFGMSNRIANTTGMRPNDEFYLMGRVPKPPRG